MPISCTQSYLNQLPWATCMVCELSAYSAGKGEPEESTLLPQLFTHSSLESLDWRNKNRNQERNSQSNKQRSRNQTGALPQAAEKVALFEFVFLLQQLMPGYSVTWWSVDGTFAHPTALLDSVTPWSSRLFHGVQKSQNQTLWGGEGLQTFKSHLLIGCFHHNINRQNCVRSIPRVSKYIRVFKSGFRLWVAASISPDCLSNFFFDLFLDWLGGPNAQPIRGKSQGTYHKYLSSPQFITKGIGKLLSNVLNLH